MNYPEVYTIEGMLSSFKNTIAQPHTIGVMRGLCGLTLLKKSKFVKQCLSADEKL